MSKDKFPVTPAIRFLRENNAEFTELLYRYVDKGGTEVSARELNVDEHSVIKTLVMDDELKESLIILMHGDCQVSTRELARQSGRRSVNPSAPETANRNTGYLVGGTSPFGTRKKMPVYVESTIFDLDKIYINGGKKGFLVGMNPKQLKILLDLEEVNVALKKC